MWLDDEEISALALRVGVCEEEFLETYTRRAARGRPAEGGRSRSLRQKRNQDCVFWDDEQGCQVYEQRPRQCRSYPFWSANLHSEENWQAEARACPGIDEGALHSAEEIARTAADDGIPARRTRARLEGDR